MTRKYFSPKRSAAKHARLMAESRGETKYLGTPCKHEGHGVVRYVTNGDCVVCQSIKKTKRRNKNE